MSYNGFYGKWDFDWDYVVHHAPEYRQYVVEGTLDWRGQVVEDQPMLTVDTAYLRQREEAPQNAYGRYINMDNFSKEDEAVLSLMRNEASPADTVQEPEQPLAPNEIRGAEIEAIEQIAEDVSEAEKYTRFVSEREKKVQALKSRGKYIKKFTLKYDHAQAHYTPVTPIVPLLPPPKAALASGSHYNLGPNYMYHINSHRWFDDRAIVSVYAVEEDDTFIRMFTYQFILNKAWHSAKRTNHDKHRIVFNKKTGNMYLINHERPKGEKKGRFQCKIYGVSSQVMYVGICFHHFKTAHVAWFIHRMLKAAQDRIGTVCLPDRDEKRAITIDIAGQVLSLLWQYKAKTHMPWLSEHIFQALETIRGSYSAYDKDAEKGLKKRSLAKMLKKKPHPSTVVKYLLGPLYNNTAYKLVMAESNRHMHGMVPFLKHMSKDKALHHFVSHVLSENNDSFKGRMVDSLAAASGEMTAYGSREPLPEELRLFDKYVRLLAQFYKADGIEARTVTWHTFRDTFSMAARFNISINMSQLTDADTVNAIHDRFSAYIQRDKKALRELQRKPFMPFAHPDKDYNGFKFEFLGTAQELVDEGRVMKHCVGGYGYRCAEGSSIIFSMRKDGISLITIEVDGKSIGCRILQMYTRHDVTVTNPEILKLVDEWSKDITKMHRADTETYADRIQIVAKFIGNARMLTVPNNPPEIAQSLMDERSGLLGELDALGLVDYAKQIVDASIPKDQSDFEEDEWGFEAAPVPTVVAPPIEPVQAMPVPGSPAEVDHGRIMAELRRMRERLQLLTQAAREVCHV